MKYPCRILRSRRKLVKASVFLLLLLIIFLALENSFSESFTDVVDLGVFLASRDTPSRQAVLPDEETVVHGVHNECNLGNGSEILTLFVVISAPKNTVARDIIRRGFKTHLKDYNSYASNSKTNTLLFFTGIPTGAEDKEKILDEAQFHNDLIVDSFAESYYNLTLKSLRMLKWIERNCYHAEFMVKVDDDVHLNLRRLLSLLENLSRESAGRNLVAGTLVQKVLPVRDVSSVYGKWYTPYELWPGEVFPDFIAGYFYLLGAEARSRIYQKALTLPMFHLEDVFLTGIVPKAVGLKLTDLPIISSWWSPFMNFVKTSCDLEKYYMGVHFHTKGFNYLDCWKSFNDKDFQCSKWPLVRYCWM